MIRPLSLQARIFGLAMIPVVLLTVLLGAYMIAQRARDLETGLQQRGQLIARQLAAAADYGVFSGNRAALDALAASVSTEASVRAVMILGREGDLLAANGRPSVVLSGPGVTAADDDAQRRVFLEHIRSPAIVVDDFAAAPAALGAARDQGLPAGVAVVELSTAHLTRELALFAATVVALLSVVLLVTWLFARRMSARLTRPIVEVANAAERIGRGESGVRVGRFSIGVLQLLGRGINEMAGRLDRSRQEMEARIEEATAQLVVKIREAEQANAAKTRFLAAASHDLRQPLHALGMFVHSLLAREREPARRALVEQVDRSVEAMSNLLDALLDISRLDAGSIQAQPQEFALQPLFDRIDSAYAELARARGLELVVEPTAWWVRSDPILLERILGNLVSNAVRYTRAGRIALLARRAAGGVRIQVRDAGIGIPEHAQTAIFEEFVQLDNPERDRSKGLGLGLAIVSRLAALLEHPLELRSAPGRGSTFSLRLPCVAARPGAEPLAVGAEAAGQFRGLRVLIIDDDVLVRRSAEQMLRDWGCETIADAGADELVGDLVESEWCPQLVLCDYRLAGGRRGTELADRIRAAFASRIPTAIVTGDTDPGSVREIELAGYQTLPKPLRPARLATMIRALLRESAKLAEA